MSEDVTVLGELAAAATPGTWQAHDGRLFVRLSDLSEAEGALLRERRPDWEESLDETEEDLLVLANFGYDPQSTTDAQYAAMAARSMSGVLALVARLRSDVATYRAIAGRLADSVDEIAHSTDPRTSKRLAKATEAWEQEMRDAGTSVANARKNQVLENPWLPKAAGAQHDHDKGPLS